MNCKRCHQQLSSYLDRSLPAQEISRMAAHLAGCDRCAAELHSFQQCMQVLERPLRQLPPPDILREVKARAQQASRPTPAPALRWAMAAGTAMLLAIGMICSLAGHHPRQHAHHAVTPPVQVAQHVAPRPAAQPATPPANVEAPAPATGLPEHTAQPRLLAARLHHLNRLVLPAPSHPAIQSPQRHTTPNAPADPDTDPITITQTPANDQTVAASQPPADSGNDPIIITEEPVSREPGAAAPSPADQSSPANQTMVQYSQLPNIGPPGFNRQSPPPYRLVTN